MPWPTYQNGQYVPVSGRASRSEGQLNIADFGGGGQLLGNLYRHGPYFGCEFQVEWGPIERGLATGMQLDIHSFVAVLMVCQSSSFAMAEVFQEWRTRGIFTPGCGPKCVFTVLTGRGIRTAPAGAPEGASLWRSLRREGIVVRCACPTWVRVVGDSNILER